MSGDKSCGKQEVTIPNADQITGVRATSPLKMSTNYDFPISSLCCKFSSTFANRTCKITYFISCTKQCLLVCHCDRSEMSALHVKFPCPVLRLRLIFEKGKLRVDKIVEVPKMTLHKSFPLRNQNVTGSWYELVDSKGKVLYRMISEDPTRHSVEVPNKDGTFYRTEVKTDRIVSNVLIPDTEEADEIRFFVQEKPPPEPIKYAAAFNIRDLKSQRKKK